MFPCFAISMVFDINAERVHPVVRTPYPWTSSQFWIASMWVERPSPSGPSMAISLPLSPFRLRYVKPSPKYRFSLFMSVSIGFVRPEPLRSRLSDPSLTSVYFLRFLAARDSYLIDQYLVY